MSDEPTIPMAPAQPPNNEPAEQDEDEQDDKRNKGGRRSNKELSRENDRLAAENAALRQSLSDFAAIPDDPTKGQDTVLYVLSRNGVQHQIHARDLRNASKLLRA